MSLPSFGAGTFHVSTGPSLKWQGWAADAGVGLEGVLLGEKLQSANLFPELDVLWRYRCMDWSLTQGTHGTLTLIKPLIQLSISSKYRGQRNVLSCTITMQSVKLTAMGNITI